MQVLICDWWQWLELVRWAGRGGEGGGGRGGGDDMLPAGRWLFSECLMEN